MPAASPLSLFPFLSLFSSYGQFFSVPRLFFAMSLCAEAPGFLACGGSFRGTVVMMVNLMELRSLTTTLSLCCGEQFLLLSSAGRWDVCAQGGPDFRYFLSLFTCRGRV